MTIILFLLSTLLSQEFEIDGNLTVQGEIIFQDSSSISTAPNGVPIGALMPFAGETAPEGWLFCDGSEISREDYSILFSVIGEIYGDGDGTTFNLPDLRGRMPLGLDNMGGESADRVENEAGDYLGGFAGEELHQLSFEELPSRIGYSGHANRGQGDSGGSFNYVHQLYTDTIGFDQPHNNMPPYLSLNFIIRY